MYADVKTACIKCGSEATLSSIVVIARGRLKCRAFYDCQGNCKKTTFMQIIDDKDLERAFYDTLHLRLEPSYDMED